MPWKLIRGGHDKPDNPNECDKCGSTNCTITRGNPKDPNDHFDLRKCSGCKNEWITPW
jgi:hypothetical protein